MTPTETDAVVVAAIFLDLFVSCAREGRAMTRNEETYDIKTTVRICLKHVLIFLCFFLFSLTTWRHSLCVNDAAARRQDAIFTSISVLDVSSLDLQAISDALGDHVRSVLLCNRRLYQE